MGDTTMSTTVGIILIIATTAYLFVYSFTLLAIVRSKELIQLPCYRIMLALGCFDIIQLFLIGYVPGFMFFVNVISDATNKVLGGILMFGYFGATSLAAMLAVNRLVTVIKGSTAETVFSGQKGLVWIGCAVVYAFVQSGFYFAPDIGMMFGTEKYYWAFLNTTQSDDIQVVWLVSDGISVGTMLICYVSLAIVLKAMRQSTDSKKLSKNDKRALLSALLVAVDITGLDIYFLTTNALIYSLAMSASHHCVWLMTVGNNAVYYIVFNDTVRREFVKLTYGKKEQTAAAVFVVNNNHSKHTTGTNHS